MCLGEWEGARERGWPEHRGVALAERPPQGHPRASLDQGMLGPAPSSHPTPKPLACCTHHCYKPTMALTQQPARLLGDGSVHSFIHSFIHLFVLSFLQPLTNTLCESPGCPAGWLGIQWAPIPRPLPRRPLPTDQQETTSSPVYVRKLSQLTLGGFLAQQEGSSDGRG